MKYILLLWVLFSYSCQLCAQAKSSLATGSYAHARIYPKGNMPQRVWRLRIQNDTVHYLNAAKRPAHMPLAEIRQIKASTATRILPFAGLGALTGLLAGAQWTIDNPLVDQPLPVLLGTTLVGTGIGAGVGLFNRKWTNIYPIR
ncbi:MAG: hypothetical protein AAF587_23110 [Bacteroidota bacterium]